MKLAYILSTPDHSVNTLLATLAQKLMSDGVAVIGTTQINTPRPKNHKCDMDITVLPDGKILRISQDLGENSSGCRLNPHALEEAVVMTSNRLDDAAFLIVNKFGKHESEGRGFRDVIAEAVMRDIPVLVAINRLNIEAFEAFSGGEAQHIEPTLEAVMSWVALNMNQAA